jgi:hypothetical protein
VEPNNIVLKKKTCIQCLHINKLIGQLTQMLLSSLMLCAKCFFTFVALAMIVLQIGVH